MRRPCFKKLDAMLGHVAYGEFAVPRARVKAKCPSVVNWDAGLLFQ